LGHISVGVDKKPYDLSRAMPIVHSIAQQAVASMMRWIGDTHGFQNIILVGGGAYLFKKAIKEGFPRHKILEVKDPLHANVRGFQIAGMNHAPKLFSAVASATQGGA
jgi:plasmid segregation protein ParM